MRKSILILPFAVAVIGGLTIAGPAFADTTGTTPLTFAVTGGELAITVPTGAVNLGTVSASASAQTVSAPLGTVTVTDNRGGTDGWTVTASAIDFTGPQVISASAPGGSSYTTPAASTTGVSTVTPTSLNALYPTAAVQVATDVAGVNSATWNPTISVTIPADAVAGAYTSTITHSVS
jgi:hypothetical protein